MRGSAHSEHDASLALLHVYLYGRLASLHSACDASECVQQGKLTGCQVLAGIVLVCFTITEVGLESMFGLNYGSQHSVAMHLLGVAVCFS